MLSHVYIYLKKLNKIKIALHCSYRNFPENFNCPMFTDIYTDYMSLGRTFDCRSLDIYIVVWFPWVIKLKVLNCKRIFCSFGNILI